MRILHFLFITLLFVQASFAANPKLVLASGDLIFQDLDCGEMCNAIEEVTQGYAGQRFSHVGLVYRSGKTLMVIEAVGSGVRMVPLDSFLSRTPNKMFVGRVKKKYRRLIRKALIFSLKQIGTPYDKSFKYNNGKYYCSELIYDAFLFANHQQPFFQLEPMTFRQPGSADYFPVWITYFQKLDLPIPEGEPGCNPGGLSRSEKIEIIGEL